MANSPEHLCLKSFRDVYFVLQQRPTNICRDYSVRKRLDWFRMRSLIAREDDDFHDKDLLAFV